MPIVFADDKKKAIQPSLDKVFAAVKEAPFFFFFSFFSAINMQKNEHTFFIKTVCRDPGEALHRGIDLNMKKTD